MVHISVKRCVGTHSKSFLSPHTPYTEGFLVTTAWLRSYAESIRTARRVPRALHRLQIYRAKEMSCSSYGSPFREGTWRTCINLSQDGGLSSWMEPD
jgi:hypothetical protein